MKLWLLRPNPKRKADPWESTYDMNYGFVVCAKTDEEARFLASSMSHEEGSQTWLDNELTTCKELKARGKPRVIMQDFLAG